VLDESRFARLSGAEKKTAFLFSRRRQIYDALAISRACQSSFKVYCNRCRLSRQIYKIFAD
jgi:hypothetical protein